MGEDRERRSDRDHPVKASWRTVTVRCNNGMELSGNERLVALMRWLRGDSSLDKQVIDPAQERVITDPMEVNWARFPLQEAMAAVSTDEGRTSGIHLRSPRAAMTPHSLARAEAPAGPKSRSAITVREK